MDALAEAHQLAALALLLIISHQIKTASFRFNLPRLVASI